MRTKLTLALLLARLTMLIGLAGCEDEWLEHHHDREWDRHERHEAEERREAEHREERLEEEGR